MGHLRKGRDNRKSRREVVAENQRKHDALSVTEKIAKAKSRPGKSAKEIKRLRASDSEQVTE